jgi:hypothetical protein
VLVALYAAGPGVFWYLVRVVRVRLRVVRVRVRVK